MLQKQKHADAIDTKNSSSYAKSMDLKHYCQIHTQSALARDMKVTPSMIYQWVTGRRRISAETAVRIESVTHGLVHRSELRPDLWEKQLASHLNGIERE